MYIMDILYLNFDITPFVVLFFSRDFFFFHQLSTGKDKYIQSFELNKELSERGSLIIYIDTVQSMPLFPYIVSFLFL